MTSKIVRRVGAGVAGAVLGMMASVAPGYAAKEVKWAAVYYEWQTGKYGWARPFTTRRDALKAAYNHAISNGMNPKKYRHRAWATRNGCIFIYKAVDSMHWSWGQSRNRDRARLTALKRCERGGHQCRKRVEVCYDE